MSVVTPGISILDAVTQPTQSASQRDKWRRPNTCTGRPSLFLRSCAAAWRTAPGSAVAAPRGGVRHGGSFGSGTAPLARTPALLADPGAALLAIHLPAIVSAAYANRLAAAPAIKPPNRLLHRPRALPPGAGQHRSEQA
jgi:hypothetical protein